jgi:hypothetical protein
VQQAKKLRPVAPKRTSPEERTGTGEDNQDGEDSPRGALEEVNLAKGRLHQKEENYEEKYQVWLSAGMHRKCSGSTPH